LWLIALEAENLTLSHRHRSLGTDALAVGAMGIAAIWRRRAPLAFVGFVLACASVLVADWNANDVTVAPIYLLIVVPYTVGREASGLRALIGLTAVLVWGVVVNATAGPTTPSGYVSGMASTAVAWTAGRWLRARRLVNEELQRSAQRIEAERDSRVRLAVADERTRIARELHTLVAANVSAMVIQAEAAELLLVDDRDAADVAMAAVEQIGRDALSDMRRVLGVLRHSGELASLTPQPGVGQVYSLVEATRDGGRQVELTVEGEPGPLPASADLGLYRILGEALADDAGAARIWLRFGDNTVELEIIAASVNGESPWPTLAMRERAALCSGVVECDLHADGRRLVVSLPRALEEVFA